MQSRRASQFNGAQNKPNTAQQLNRRQWILALESCVRQTFFPLSLATAQWEQEMNGDILVRPIWSKNCGWKRQSVRAVRARREIEMSSKLRVPPLLFLLLLLSIVSSGQCVNLNKLDQLKKDDLLELDREVSIYYNDTYKRIDEKKLSYNEQLFRSMRAIRHTNVINQFDYVYTDDKTMRDSVGQQVNLQRCLHQLSILDLLARRATESRQTVPLSAIDMLEAGGRPESGILNGNFVWLGSYVSCQHARIAQEHLAALTWLASSSPVPAFNSSDGDIVGRYCVAHLRAKSWPIDDPYFGDRISLKAGLCLPQACHTNSYADSQEVRDRIESLTKFNMIAPFDGDEYEVNYLYCVPDEDSPHRELNLGAKLFFVFVGIWSMMLLYSNIKYQRRLRAMKKLNESIDIRMIVEQKSAGNERTEEAQEEELPGDEADRAVKQISLAKKRSNVGRKPDAVGRFDFVKAFSVKANIDFLFRRSNFINTRASQESKIALSSNLHVNQKTSPTTRRLSASNAALIKDLKEQENCQVTAGCKKLDESSSAVRAETDLNGANQATNRKRVNIDVLDGIKVFATGYIVYGHTLMFFLGFLTDARFATHRMMDFTMISTINALQVVGLFYIITGVLISYLAFSRQKVAQLLQPSFWMVVIVGRYLRLLPSYLLVFWFAKHVAPFAGSGPFWLEYRVDNQQPRSYCSGESWLTMLTMSAADVKIPYDCVPQAWYLSNDFRTLFVIPIYVILLAVNATAGYAAIFSTLMFSAFRMTHILREANIDYKILLQWQPHVYSILADRLHDVYTNLSIRLSTYLLGVIVGHILYLHETGQLRRPPRWLRRFALRAALLIGSMSFMGAPLMATGCFNRFLPSPDQVHSDTVVILIPLLKTTMELCICLTLLSLTTGGGFRWLTELLSSQPARVLSNISYGVFLVHVEVMYKLPLHKYESNYYFLFLYAAFFILLSNLIAFFVHILYEMPINNVLRHLFKKIIQLLVK